MNIQRKYDIYFRLHNGKKHNPFLFLRLWFHVGLAELFHDDSRAKLVIEILNKIGLCISYDELQRIDFGLMK